MENSQGPSRKPVPTSRAINLQMLTHTPSSAPLETKMFSESLQPLRPPPIYSTDSFAPAPALPAIGNGINNGGFQFHTAQYNDTTRRVPPIAENTEREEEEEEEESVPMPAMFSSTPARRAVSLPAAPVTRSSPYDSMFTFSTELPEDFVETVRIPKSTIYSNGSSMKQLPEAPYVSGTNGRISMPPTLGLRSDRSVSAGASMSSGSYKYPSPPTYSSDSRASMPAPPSLQNGRTFSSGSAVLLSPLARTPPDAAGKTDKSKRPSVLNSLGSWLDKTKDSSKFSNGR